MLPSGKQFVYRNRIGWARTYLKKAELLSSPGKTQIQITDRGQKVLSENPAKVDVNYLKQFEEFVEFHSYKAKETQITDSNFLDNDNVTPEEILESAHKDILTDLADELLEKVKSCSPEFFEYLVLDLLLKMGYGSSREDAGKVIGRSGDGGIDGIINEDRLGLDIVCIQAKRWENPVGRPTIQGFAGSLEAVRAKKGVLITTSKFTQDALDYIKHIEKRIVLIDGYALAKHMIDFNVGVSIANTFEVKKIDSDYFE